MSYTYNAESLVKEGDYEALVEKMEVKTLPSGKNKLAVWFRIRNDVEQPYANKVLFDDIWAEKNNPEIFNRKRINQLLGTQEIEDGREFASIKDIISFLDKAPLIIHVGIELNEWKGEDVNVIKYYKKSKLVAKKVGEETANTATSGTIEDEDLPF